jgi:hypothetical protein
MKILKGIEVATIFNGAVDMHRQHENYQNLHIF